jgi:hypothetical protein
MSWVQYCYLIDYRRFIVITPTSVLGHSLLASLSSYIIHSWNEEHLKAERTENIELFTIKRFPDIYDTQWDDTRITLGHVSRIKELGLPGKWNIRQLVVFFESAYLITTQVKASKIPECLWWGGLGNGPDLLAKVQGSTFASMLNQSRKRDAQNTNFQPTKTCRRLGLTQDLYRSNEKTLWGKMPAFDILSTTGEYSSSVFEDCLSGKVFDLEADTERAVEGDQAVGFTRTVRLCFE